LSKLLKETNILEYKQAILKYLSIAANISNKQEFFKQLKMYSQEIGYNGGKFMGTLAEYWFEDGMQKGKQESTKAIAQKMLKAKVDIKTITKFTGLKAVELENLV
jgi:predicted transposase YdaD